MTEDKLDKVLKHLEELDKRIADIESNLSIAEMKIPEKVHKIQITTREESFMEFFIKYRLQTDTDKTLVIMHFLESRRNIQNLTSRQIFEGFKEVREKPPQNISDKIQMLHKKGLIMPGEMVNKIQGWMITRTGLDYLNKLKEGVKGQ